MKIGGEKSILKKGNTPFDFRPTGVLPSKTNNQNVLLRSFVLNNSNSNLEIQNMEKENE